MVTIRSVLTADRRYFIRTDGVKKLLTKIITNFLFKLTNEENEWDHRISAGVKEGPADCIRIDEAAAALKRFKDIKPHGCQASSRNDTSHRDNGTQWILDLC